jgi:hypothetical protein
MTGSLVARVLSTAWRPNPHATDFSVNELAEVLPLLLGSGAGALSWHRVKQSELQSSPAGLELQQAYRHHTLEAARHERDIRVVLKLLRENDVEPILIKGWSIARLYPVKGMRPYDDTDLVIPSDRYLIAEKVIKEQKLTEFSVDLHYGVEEFGYGNDDTFFEHSRLIRLGEVYVRVPGPEDSLRISCLHLLQHGAFRPLWLCDVAVAVESRESNFDWDRCLGSDKRTTDWIACTIGLAHQLLGARVDDTPVRHRAQNLPGWMIPTVLKLWEKPFAIHHGVARHRAPMASYFRNPSGLLRDIRTRWPNPIEATINLHGAFNELPRLPYQVGDCIARATRFAFRLPKLIKNSTTVKDDMKNGDTVIER